MKYLVVIMALVLAALFYKSFQPEQVVFSNDGPYGVMASEECEPLQQIGGGWQDLNWLGEEYPTPGFSGGYGFRVFTYYPLKPILVLILAGIFGCWWGLRECFGSKLRKVVVVLIIMTLVGCAGEMLGGRLGMWSACSGLVMIVSFLAIPPAPKNQEQEAWDQNIRAGLRGDGSKLV